MYVDQRNTLVANPRNTSFQESTKPRNSLPVAPAETMLVQFLLPFLVTFPLPSFATNTTTSKGRVTRESHGGSSLFKLDPRPLSVCFLFRTSGFSQSSRLNYSRGDDIQMR